MTLFQGQGGRTAPAPLAMNGCNTVLRMENVSLTG